MRFSPLIRRSALVVVLGCSSHKADPPQLPTTLEGAFQALCQRKVECVKVIKDTDGATQVCVASRVNAASAGTPEAREALRAQVVDQAKQCLSLPCEQFETCEDRVFNAHLEKLPKD